MQRDSNEQLDRRVLWIGKMHKNWEKASRSEFCPGSTSTFTWKRVWGGNNLVSVLCSSFEHVRNGFTTEGQAPRQMQEACAGEVSPAASYPTPSSPLWADRVARSVTERKWCGSWNWQGGNLIFFFSFFLGQDCTCSLQQAGFCWEADVTLLCCRASPHPSSVSPGGVLRRKSRVQLRRAHVSCLFLLAGFVCRHWLEYPIITFSHFLI